MKPLRPNDFSAFFKAIHGKEPFPWQARLADEVVSTGSWPRLLDLPTGTGKTAALDVAVFAQACDAARPPRERHAPRHTVYVVDRRIVVDQAHDRAKRIANKLASAKGDILGLVADALRKLSREGSAGDGVPLAVASLRGGMVRDDGWARTPDQPLIVVSTVDQVGSRLLFRGYGVSRSMSPVHAGLLGNDTLLLLDEVHLSRPFADTLDDLAVHFETVRGGLPRRSRVVALSATPRPSLSHESEASFRLAAADREHPVLARRLRAKKPTRLVELKSSADDAVGTARELARLARELVGRGCRTTAVVVNRVDLARRVHRELVNAPGPECVGAALLTGRMRPLERDEKVKEVVARVGGDRDRAQDADMTPFVLVATQCIEAGADLDVDGLVTECASLDALRQRFGRLDRRGEAPTCHAVVCSRRVSAPKKKGKKSEAKEGGEATSDDATKLPGDPIYGTALAETWLWLKAHEEGLDFGNLTLPEGSELERLVAPSPQGPVLLPAHLESWAQTSPRPHPDPEPSLWLHGTERGSPEVHVVWRADLSSQLLLDACSSESSREAILATLDACPPGSLEALAVPLWQARGWLEGRLEVASSQDTGDVEAAPRVDEFREREGVAPWPVVIWRGEESTIQLEIHAGDTLVVPASYGGIDPSTRCWDPCAKDDVLDLGESVQARQRGRAVLRLHPDVLAGVERARGVELPRAPVPHDAQDDVDPLPELREWLDTTEERLAARHSEGDALLPIVRGLRCRFRPVRLETVDSSFWVLVGLKPLQRDLTEADGVVTSEDDDTASFTGRRVPLAEHSRDVRDFAQDFAERLGLPPALVEDLNHRPGSCDDARFTRRASAARLHVGA